MNTTWCACGKDFLLTFIIGGVQVQTMWCPHFKRCAVQMENMERTLYPYENHVMLT